MALEPGRVRLRGVTRSFRILHDRNLTLKETALRRRRTHSTELVAVRGLDLDIAPGEAVGIIGQNGSGKSTLLKMLAGIIPPDSGTVEMGGTVASMLELGAGFHPDFSGRENVYMNASIHGLSKADVDARFDEIVAFAEIPEFIDMPVRTYSSGMAMRLAFAIASHVNPDVLLLDEVLAVGDEAFQRKCMGRIFEFRRRGGTLVFVSHDPAAVERVCDRAVLLRDGGMVADGRPADVLSSYHALLAHDGETPVSTGAPAADDSRLQWGNGAVTIDALRVVGPQGPTDRLMSGESLAIEIDVSAGTPVTTPVFGIAIHTTEGALCYGTNTHMDELAVEELAGAATVRFSVPRLGLHEGRFTVTAAVHSQDEATVYHWLDRWVEFSVFPQVTGVGAVDMSGSWSLQTRERIPG
jgi:ABC-type polysaccharide/polyol phosphate transport system ATPase subunit